MCATHTNVHTDKTVDWCSRFSITELYAVYTVCFRWFLLVCTTFCDNVYRAKVQLGRLIKGYDLMDNAQVQSRWGPGLLKNDDVLFFFIIKIIVMICLLFSKETVSLKSSRNFNWTSVKYLEIFLINYVYLLSKKLWLVRYSEYKRSQKCSVT